MLSHSRCFGTSPPPAFCWMWMSWQKRPVTTVMRESFLPCAFRITCSLYKPAVSKLQRGTTGRMMQHHHHRYICLGQNRLKRKERLTIPLATATFTPASSEEEQMSFLLNLTFRHAMTMILLSTPTWSLVSTITMLFPTTGLDRQEPEQPWKRRELWSRTAAT